MDMKSHTRYCLTLRTKSPTSISGSAGQKVDSRSLTEAELVGFGDAIGFVEWTRLSFKDQVKIYPLKRPFKDLGKKNLVKQDNISTIKIVKGDRRVCGSRTQNIHIRYFYAHERVNNGTIVVTYCPITEVVRNYISKPLQGSLF